MKSPYLWRFSCFWRMEITNYSGLIYRRLMFFLFIDLWQSDFHKIMFDHSNLAVSCGVMKLCLQSLCIHCQRNLVMALSQFIDLDALGRCLVSFVGLLWNNGGRLLKIDFENFECEVLNKCKGWLYMMSRCVLSFH